MDSILAAIKGDLTLRELKEQKHEAYKAYRAEVSRRYGERNREALLKKRAEKRRAAGMKEQINFVAAETEGERRARFRSYGRRARAVPGAKEKLNAKRREWRKANPELTKAQNKRWELANPDKVRARTRNYQNKRRAARVSATGIPFTLTQLEARLSMYAGCWICGGAKEEMDHVKPLSVGGFHCLSNLRPICRSCNARKNNKWPYPS
jgi:hypothetical protein